VHVVRHHFEGVDCQPEFGRLLGQRRLEPIGDRTLEDRPSVLGAPDDVVLQREDGASVLGVSAVHTSYYMTAGQLVNTFVH
jgi:hypothetical protein